MKTSSLHRQSLAVGVLGAFAMSLLVPVSGQAALALEEPESVSPQPTTITMHGIGMGAYLNTQLCDLNNDGYGDLSANVRDAFSTSTWRDSEAERSTEGLTNTFAQSPANNDWTNASTSTSTFTQCVSSVNGDAYDDVLVLPLPTQTTLRTVNLNVYGSEPNAAGKTLAKRLVNYTFPLSSAQNPLNLGAKGSGSAGDFDNDGYNDVAFSQHASSTNGLTANGRIWVFAGRASEVSPESVLAFDFTSNPEYFQDPSVVTAQITGESAGDNLGALKAVGDLNGDDIDDLLIASSVSRKVWLIYGKPTGTTTREVHLANLDPSDGVLFAQATNGAGFGSKIDVIDDVNGDGIQDYLFGLATTNTGTGGAVVVFGSNDNAVSTVDFSAGQVAGGSGTEPRGYVITQEKTSDGLGYSAAGLGDLNGDGKSDLILGAPGYDAKDASGATITDSGAVYVVYGKADGAKQSVTDLAPDSTGYRIDGWRGRGQSTTVQSYFGTSVARIGDIDKNGVEDFAFGAPGFINGTAASKGAAFVALRGDVGSKLTLTAGRYVGDVPQEFGAESELSAGESYALSANLQLTTLKGHAGTLSFALDDETIGDCASVESGEPDPLKAHQSLASCNPESGISVEDFGKHTFSVQYGGAGAITGSSGELEFFVSDSSSTLLSAEDRQDVSQLVLTAQVAPESSEKQVGGGTVAFSEGESVFEPCAEVPVNEGTAICTIERPAPGEHAYTAAFSGVSEQKSDGASVVVLAASTVTETIEVSKRSDGAGKLALDGRLVEFGDRVTASFTTSQDLPAEVEFRAGTTVLGSAKLIDGVAEFEISGLAAGKYDIVAVYPGDDLYASFESNSVSLRISKLASETETPRLSTSKQVYGAGAVTASVSVPDASDGSVTFYDSGRVLGRAAVSASGVASLRLSNLAAGRHEISARFSGGTNVAASALSDESVLTVSKAKPKSIKVSAKKFKKNTKPTVTVKVGKLSNGAYPTGKVTVKVGSYKKTVNLKASQKGKVTVKLGKKYNKAITVKASFKPSDTKNVSAVNAKSIKVKVKK